MGWQVARHGCMIAWVGWVDRLGCVAVGLVALGWRCFIAALLCVGGLPLVESFAWFFLLRLYRNGFGRVLDWIGIVPGFGSRGFAARVHWVLSPVEFCGWRGRVLSRYFAIAWIG